MNFEKTCDPEIMKKIAFDWLKTINTPRVVTENRPFSIVDDETGEETKYDSNMNHIYFLLAASLDKFIETDDYGISSSYFNRILSAQRFVAKNKEYLKEQDLVKLTPTHTLISEFVYEAAATCKIGKRGFRFKDMVKEIKKYSEIQKKRLQ